jgi:hypothetical protein
VQRLTTVPGLERPESLIPEHPSYDAPESVVVFRDEDRRRALASLGRIGHKNPVERGRQEKIPEPGTDASRIIRYLPFRGRP